MKTNKRKRIQFKPNTVGILGILTLFSIITMLIVYLVNSDYTSKVLSSVIFIILSISLLISVHYDIEREKLSLGIWFNGVKPSLQDMCNILSSYHKTDIIYIDYDDESGYKFIYTLKNNDKYSLDILKGINKIG